MRINELSCLFVENKIILQEVFLPLLTEKEIQLFVLRLDTLHPQISGNKWFKLKYNLQKAKIEGYTTILSFGGAFSNHIHALASAGNLLGLKTIGIIRGEETLPYNPNIAFVQKMGMKLYYWDRKSYSQKHTPEALAFLQEKFGNFFLVPEGGANLLALQGCGEIMSLIPEKVEYICTACGTGSTLAGLLTKNPSETKILGFPVLKNGEFLEKEILNLLANFEKIYNSTLNNPTFELHTQYHFGGYAKQKPDLIRFIQDFQRQTQIPLDWVYTGKMMFGIFDLIKQDFFKPKSKIIALHTGGIMNASVIDEM